MFDTKTTTINLDQEEDITRIYHTYGYGDSAHSFRSIYIWAKDMSLSICFCDSLYAVKIGDDISSTWMFPVGSKEKKIEFINSLLAEGNLIFKYMTIEDVYFLQQHFPGKFVMDPAPDDSEYIYDRNTIENLPGGSFASKRNYVKQLLRDHDVETRLFSSELVSDVAQISRAWSSCKGKDTLIFDQFASKVILSEYDKLDINGAVIYLDDAPCAAILGYRLEDNTVDCCVQKTDSYLHGLQYYMRQEFSKMQPPEIEFFNWEEDLGIEGLRTAKQYMHPCSMIHMYTGRQT